MVPILKSIHIVGLLFWCAGLLCLPTLLRTHRGARSPHDFAELRILVRRLYVGALTPAAVLAVAAGTALVFAREVYTGWMFAKLALVALLVAVHAYQGHLLVETGHGHADPVPGRKQTVALTGAAALLMAAIITVVLAKPDLRSEMLPAWLLEPRDRQLSELTPI